jgi:serine/threonine protein kinase
MTPESGWNPINGGPAPDGQVVSEGQPPLIHRDGEYRQQKDPGGNATPGPGSLATLVGTGDSFVEGSASPEREDRNLAGKTIGSYQLKRLLGRGAMGVVYEGYDIKLNRRVAIKLIRQRWQSPLMQARFIQEASIAASLEHSNILPIYHVGEQDGMVYIVMRCIDGKSLEKAFLSPQETWDQPVWQGRSQNCMQPVSRMAPDRVARLGITLCHAIGYAHRMGVLHCDIKPGNLLMGKDGHLWLTDFGLADPLIRDQAPASLIGTIGYISPEMAGVVPGRIDHRSDLYSLGATLYHLAAGAAPYTGGSQGYRSWIQQQEPQLLSRLIPSFPSDLETILHKAMARIPDDRYSDAAALAEDLERFLAYRPIHARPPSWSDRLRKAARRNRKPLAFFGTAMLTALLLFAVAMTFLYRDREQQRQRALQLAQHNQTLLEEATLAFQQTRQSRDNLERLVGDLFQHLDDQGNLIISSQQDQPPRLLIRAARMFDQLVRDGISGNREHYLAAQMSYYAAMNLQRINLSDADGISMAKRSLELFESYAAWNEDPIYRLDVARGQVLLMMGLQRHDPQASEFYSHAANRTIQSLVDQFPDDLRFLDAYAFSQRVAGDLAMGRGDRLAAMESLDRSIEAAMQCQERNPERSSFYGSNEAIARFLRAKVLRDCGRREEAMDEARRATDRFRDLRDDWVRQHGNQIDPHQQLHWASIALLARTLVDAGKPDQAASVMTDWWKETSAIRERGLKSISEAVQWHDDLVLAMTLRPALRQSIESLAQAMPLDRHSLQRPQWLPIMASLAIGAPWDIDLHGHLIQAMEENPEHTRLLELCLEHLVRWERWDHFQRVCRLESQNIKRIEMGDAFRAMEAHRADNLPTAQQLHLQARSRYLALQDSEKRIRRDFAHHVERVFRPSIPTEDVAAMPSR